MTVSYMKSWTLSVFITIDFVETSIALVHTNSSIDLLNVEFNKWTNLYRSRFRGKYNQWWVLVNYLHHVKMPDVYSSRDRTNTILINIYIISNKYLYYKNDTITLANTLMMLPCWFKVSVLLNCPSDLIQRISCFSTGPFS